MFVHLDGGLPADELGRKIFSRVLPLIRKVS
jgi:hypothetical protein